MDFMDTVEVMDLFVKRGITESLKHEQMEVKEIYYWQIIAIVLF